jgi:putative transcriptional regulator
LSRVGSYLVARPSIETGFFRRSVIYIYEDTERGTAGLALHQPMELGLCDLAAQIGIAYPRDRNRIYQGGPVNERAVTLLHSPEWRSSNTIPASMLCLSSDQDMIGRLARGDQPNYFRLCAGASVWAAGQLDFEISKRHWLLGSLSDELVFTKWGDDLWNTAIESIGRETFAKFI